MTATELIIRLAIGGVSAYAIYETIRDVAGARERLRRGYRAEYWLAIIKAGGLLIGLLALGAVGACLFVFRTSMNVVWATVAVSIAGHLVWLVTGSILAWYEGRREGRSG